MVYKCNGSSVSRFLNMKMVLAVKIKNMTTALRMEINIQFSRERLSHF